MRLFRPLFALALLCVSLTSGAQGVLRHAYRNNGFAYIGTERNSIAGTHPFQEKMDYVVFPDGSTAVILELDFQEPQAINFPKAVSMTATLESGKRLIFKQHSTAGASRSFVTEGGSRLWWCQARYVLEEEDVRKLITGVKHLDVVYGWAPDSYFGIDFKNNEFSKALKAQFDLVKSTPVPAQEVGDYVADYSDNSGSKTILSKPVDVAGNVKALRIGMTYMFYKNANSEDYDLNFILSDGVGVPFQGTVTFNMEDGSKVLLKQERESDELVCMYPTRDQVRTLVFGRILSVEFPSASGAVLVQSYSDNELGAAISRIYNSLQTVSEL